MNEKIVPLLTVPHLEEQLEKGEILKEEADRLLGLLTATGGEVMTDDEVRAVRRAAHLAGQKVLEDFMPGPSKYPGLRYR